MRQQKVTGSSCDSGEPKTRLQLIGTSAVNFQICCFQSVGTTFFYCFYYSLFRVAAYLFIFMLQRYHNPPNTGRKPFTMFLHFHILLTFL